MSAHSRVISAIGAVLLTGASSTALAAGVTVTLTEAAEPEGKAWEEPARISATLNAGAPDTFSAQINAEIGVRTPNIGSRKTKLTGGVIWQRESGGADEQNNFESALAFRIGRRLDLDRGGRDGAEADLYQDFLGRQFDVSTLIKAGYARTAAYPDLTSSACTTAPALRQCMTQFKESVRVAALLSLSGPGFENVIRRQNAIDGKRVVLAYSIVPQIGLSGDWLLNSPLDVKTGVVSRGTFTSATFKIAATVVPSFINPAWELSAKYQIRQLLGASATRRPSIAASAGIFDASVTYYLFNPLRDGVRAGIGVTYTRGTDSLIGAKSVNRFVIAFRLGNF
jgi:hypothetical protein